ncbi:MAG TPA: hypothetical protein PK156_05175, partial [Polyangium sp.]|nr:hypothetical protein [Polyangium sp.]
MWRRDLRMQQQRQTQLMLPVELHQLCRVRHVFSVALDRDPVLARLDPEVRVAVGLVLGVLDMADPGHLGRRV